MQSLRKPSIETQNFRCLQRFQKEKGIQVERRRRRRERGAKGVALQTSPATCRHPGVTGLFPGLPEKGGLELGPTRNQTKKIGVLCQEEVISLQSSAQAEALQPDYCVQDQGNRKTGRIGRAKERTEREYGGGVIRRSRRAVSSRITGAGGGSRRLFLFFSN